MAGSTYGLIAEFTNGEDILQAAQRVYEEGYRRTDAYTPLPVHGLAESLGFHDWLLPWLIFLGGVAGGVGGYLLQWWINRIDYPLDVGGRPLHSWPAFIPVTFECTILAAAGTAFVGMLLLNGLPRPHHPIFNARRFELASQNRFFLCIEASDPKFDLEQTAAFLNSLDPQSVSEVEQ